MKNLTVLQKVFACIFMVAIGLIALLADKIHLIQFVGLLMIAIVLIYLIGLIRPKIVFIIIGSLILIWGSLILIGFFLYKSKPNQPIDNAIDNAIQKIILNDLEKNSPPITRYASFLLLF